MNMSWGSIPRLVALLGPAKTKKLVTLCEKWSAEQASLYGLIDEITPAGSTLTKALEIRRNRRQSAIQRRAHDKTRHQCRSVRTGISGEPHR